MAFIPEKYAGHVNGDSSTRDGYLNPSKVKANGSVRFALLAEEPTCFFELWGEASDGSVRPFRFEDDPSPADIERELGSDYERRMNREGTAPEAVKFAMAVPIYNYDLERIQVLQLSQKSLQRELNKISQMEDYENLLEWDFVLTKEATVSPDMYGLRPAPRRGESNRKIDKAWNAALEAGFDISRLFTGGNPFKESV
jgi:hypothetical protein